MTTTPVTDHSTSVSAAAQFMKAYSERDRDGMTLHLVSGLGPRDDGAYAFAFALVSIADAAMRETARVLDVEPRQVREAIEAMALDHFAKEAAHG